MSFVGKNYRTDGGDKTVIGGKLEFTDDAEVINFPEGGGGDAYTLPPATASTLGGVKVGTGLSVTEEGTLSAEGITTAANVAASEATELADLVTTVNAILTALKTAGLMAADE